MPCAWAASSPSTVPAGYQAGGSYTGTPVLEAGDCSGNRFERIIFEHDTFGGHAVRFGYAGENKIGIIYGNMWTQLPGGGSGNAFGRGLVLDGYNSGGPDNGAGANNFLVEKLGTSFAALGPESGFSVPPSNPIILSNDSSDGAPGRPPIDTLGVTTTFSNDSGSPVFTLPGVLAATNVAVSGSLSLSGVGTVSASTYTVSVTDTNIVFSGTGCTVTLPSPASSTGRVLNLRTVSADAVISAASNVVPLTSLTAGTAILAATAGKWCSLVCDGTHWQTISGN